MPSVGIAAQKPASAAVVAEFLEESGHLDEALVGFTRRQAGSLRKIEETRQRCRDLERQGRALEASDGRAPWEPEWAAEDPTKRRIRSQLDRLTGPWLLRLDRVVLANRASPLSVADGQDVAAQCLRIVEAWMRLGEPTDVLRGLSNQYQALGFALGWTSDSTQRRCFLALVADRLAATPGTSDVDLLCDVVAWDELFLRAQPSGSLDILTTDLALIFTERAEDGISLSESTHYRAGRCSDVGFRETFRDGSDQVRHFCWAVRIFALASDHEQAEALLRLKEARDAQSRGEPANQADLELNRATRKLVERLHHPDQGTAEADRLSLLFRAALAEG